MGRFIKLRRFEVECGASSDTVSALLQETTDTTTRGPLSNLRARRGVTFLGQVTGPSFELRLCEPVAKSGRAILEGTVQPMGSGSKLVGYACIGQGPVLLVIVTTVVGFLVTYPRSLIGTSAGVFVALIVGVGFSSSYRKTMRALRAVGEGHARNPAGSVTFPREK